MESVRPLLIVAVVGLVLLPQHLVVGPSRVGSMLLAGARVCLSRTSA